MNQRQWQPHDVEVISVDSWNINTGIALDRIGAGLVENIFALDIIVDFAGRERSEPDIGAFEAFEGFMLPLVEDTNGRIDRVLPSGQFFQHSQRIGLIQGFAENFAVNDYDCIGRKNHRLLNVRCHIHSFVASRPNHKVFGTFTRGGNFIN